MQDKNRLIRFGFHGLAAQTVRCLLMNPTVKCVKFSPDRPFHNLEPRDMNVAEIRIANS